MTNLVHHDLSADVIIDGAPLTTALLALNAAHEAELSPLDAPRLRHLVTQAFLAMRVGESCADADALLIAFDQDADYDSPNFLWFRDRFARFVYVDRVVVAQAAQGRGHARSLYAALFRAAQDAGHDRVVCEINSLPPNPASDAFHERLGFAEIGRASLPGGAKQVRYLECRLPHAGQT